MEDKKTIFGHLLKSLDIFVCHFKYEKNAIFSRVFGNVGVAASLQFFFLNKRTILQVKY